MKYSEYVKLMKAVPYTENLEYCLGYGPTSRGRELPQLVDGVPDDIEIVKIPLYNVRGGRYVRVIGFTPAAFREKGNITDIIMSRVHNGVIMAGAFAGCRSLKRITIPSYVYRIEASAFRECTELEDVYFEGTIDEWRDTTIVHERHEIDFGELIQGTPVHTVEEERIIHIPGNDALLSANIHLGCKLEEMIPDAGYELLDEMIKGRMSVSVEEFREVLEKNKGGERS